MRSLFLSFAIATLAWGQGVTPPIQPADQLPAAKDVQELGASLKKFTEVYSVLERNAAEPVDPKVAFEGGVLPSMLRKLDPHTVFFNRDQFEQLREMETSTRKGFGSIVSIVPGRVIVLQTMPGSPSARSGLTPGDEIIAINNVLLSQFEVDQMVEFLAYTRQKDALLAVRRQNFPRPLEFVLSPATLDAPTVDRAFELKPGIGFIRIATFEEKTGRDFKNAVDKLGGGKLQGLVIDLRNNTGGVLKSALEAASLFLPVGTVITSVRGRSRQEEKIEVPKLEGFTPYSFPIVVLVNEKSASASEVLASALQDNKRAKIVGLPTYGKGLVQTVYSLSNGSGLALTTAYYYTPNGRSIQRKLEDSQIDPNLNPSAKAGLMPDVVEGLEPATRLRQFLDANGLMTQFATEWLQTQPKVEPGFRLPVQALDQFQLWLSAKNVQPRLAEWSLDRDWMMNRIEQEVMNLTLGVEKGDEVEARRDPQVKRALEAIQSRP